MNHPVESNPPPVEIEAFAQRVESLLGDENPHAFAVRNEISYTTLLRILQGKTIPRRGILQKIAKGGQVTIDWLLYGGKKPIPKLEASEVQIMELLGENVYIPLIDLQVSAGYGCEVISEEISEYLALPRRLIVTERGLNANALQAVTISGDSMLPDFNPGDIAVIDVDNNQPGEGIYVVRLDNTVVIKRMQVMTGNSIKLNSHNPTYEPVLINLEMLADSFQIIGRVVWSFRRF